MKKSIREVIINKRNRIKPAERKKKNALIEQRFLKLVDFKRAESILFYASFRSEVNTISLIKRALGKGKKIALPLVDAGKEQLRLYIINDVSELKPGYMGILEPMHKRSREITLKDINTVIIPGAGFDMNGNRLGYGKGYYDKLLSKSKMHVNIIALAFEEQIIPKVPKEVHDVSIDKIVTEERVINCKKKTADLISSAAMRI